MMHMAWWEARDWFRAALVVLDGLVIPYSYECLLGMLMKLVTAWALSGENQFVLKEECKKCYAGKKYLGILSGQVT
jgi:hypothetical protein